MGKLKTIYNRIYADYLMPSRLGEYEEIIKKSIESNYQHLSLKEYINALEKGELDENQRYFIHRHDIDTDLRTTRKMFSIEKKHGIKATYYFRLSTLDINLMKEIESYGSEASYHFEEIATYCKRNKITTRDKAMSALPQIKEEFKNNIRRIENKLGYKLVTVASHGDFVNRKLSLINNEITKDNTLRKETGLKAEAYDSKFMDNVDAYISDKPFPVYYSPTSIFNVIGKKRVICMLTHPRQWETNFWVNTKDNIQRLIEGMQFR